MANGQRGTMLLCALSCALCPIAQAAPLETGSARELQQTPPEAQPVRGPRFAPLTLDLWLAVPHEGSRLAAGLARRARERHPDVREVVHLVPAPVGDSPLVREAALEALAQGRFFPFWDRLLEERGPLAAADLEPLAAEAGLDVARLHRALEQHTHAKELERLAQEQHLGAHAAGELNVNLVRLSHLADEPLENLIEAQRRRANVLLSAGVPLSRLYQRLTDERRARADEAESLLARPRLPLSDAGAPSRGPLLAPITLTVFSNFSCLGCADLAAAVRRVREAHPGAVRVVWRNWVPAYAAYGAEALAAEYAAAAQLQGRFWELHDLALPGAAGGPRTRPLKSELEQLARSAGLDLQRLQADRRSGALAALVERDKAEAHRVRVGFNPAVFVNGIFAQPERLELLIDAELRRSLLDRLTVPGRERPSPSP